MSSSNTLNHQYNHNGVITNNNTTMMMMSNTDNDNYSRPLSTTTKSNNNINNNKVVKKPASIPKSHEDYQQDVLIQQEFQRLDQLLLRDDDDELNLSDDEPGEAASKFLPISNHQQHTFRFNGSGGGQHGHGNAGPPRGGLTGHPGSGRDTRSESSTRPSTPSVNQKLSSTMMGVSHGDGIWATCPEMSARMYLPNGILLLKLEYQPSSSSVMSTSSSSHGTGAGGSSSSNLLAKFTHPNIHILPSSDSTSVNVAFDVIYQSH